MFRFFALSVAWLVHPTLGNDSEDVGYDLLFQSTPEEFSNLCAPIAPQSSGKAVVFPSWATGDFVIGSVGLQEMGDRHFVGYLDAFGKYQKFSLKGGQVCATYRIMRTGFYNESVKANTIGPGLLFYETEPPRKCPLWNPICNLPPTAPNDNTFVNTFMHAGELLSVTDAPYMLTIDPESLNVTGTKKWDDKVAGMVAITGSAHPVKTKTGEIVDFVGNQNVVTGGVDVAVYGISEGSPDARLPIASVPMSTAPYMHSFGVTENYAVLPRMPVKFGLPLGKQMAAAFSDISIKEPGPDNAFHIVPLKGDGNRIVRPLPVEEKLYFTHEANTYESQGNVVIDLATTGFNAFSSDLTTKHELNKTFRNSCNGGEHSCLNVVKRFVVPVEGDGKITTEIVSDTRVKTDFVKINEKYKGLKHCFYYGVQWFTDYKNKASMAISKYDVCDEKPAPETKRQWTRKNWYPSEAIMVPSTDPAAPEDDGLLLFTALDGAAGKTWVVAVNATTMETYAEAGPFPRVAFTTHGQFYPSHDVYLPQQESKLKPTVAEVFV